MEKKQNTNQEFYSLHDEVRKLQGRLRQARYKARQKEKNSKNQNNEKTN